MIDFWPVTTLLSAQLRHFSLHQQCRVTDSPNPVKKKKKEKKERHQRSSSDDGVAMTRFSPRWFGATWDVRKINVLYCQLCRWATSILSLPLRYWTRRPKHWEQIWLLTFSSPTNAKIHIVRMTHGFSKNILLFHPFVSYYCPPCPPLLSFHHWKRD